MIIGPAVMPTNHSSSDQLDRLITPDRLRQPRARRATAYRSKFVMDLAEVTE